MGQSLTANPEDEETNRLKIITKKILDSGLQVEAECANLLDEIARRSNSDQLISSLLASAKEAATPFISKKMIEKIFEPQAVEQTTDLVTGKETSIWPAKDHEATIEILKTTSAQIGPHDGIERFLRHFEDRFQKLQKILRQRIDARDAQTVSRALETRPSSRVKLIAMVSEKKDLGSKIFFRVEDMEAVATVIVRAGKPGLLERARDILVDEVICVSGVKGQNEAIFADDVLLPEIPNRKPNHSSEALNLVLTSDYHFGSRIFEHRLVDRFIKWLNGKSGSQSQIDSARRVKYLVIGGDLVDGIGVYPQQEEELEITDIFNQYGAAAKFIAQIPDHIEVILIPGNHDATRRALPQPPIPHKYAEPVYEARKILSLGNPAQIRVHGVNLLLHHGRSLEDLLVSLPGATHTNPCKAMEHILRARHLSPIYGLKTPLAAEPKDSMIIESVPDIYHTGHIHIFDFANYRGTLMVNSGSWQRQTIYQKKMGLNPTCGLIPVVNLKNFQLEPIDFTELAS